MTSRPMRLAISTHRSENWPKLDIKTLSPGASVFCMADSQAPVPEEGKMKTRPSFILKTFFRSSKSGSVNLGNSGLRMSSIGRFMAMRTGSGILVGPGMNRCGCTSIGGIPPSSLSDGRSPCGARPELHPPPEAPAPVSVQIVMDFGRRPNNTRADRICHPTG